MNPNDQARDDEQPEDEKQEEIRAVKPEEKKTTVAQVAPIKRPPAKEEKKGLKGSIPKLGEGAGNL